MAGIDEEREAARLGEALNRARQGRFTVEQLAVRSGVSSGLISQIEKGRGNPSFTTLLKLGNALDLPISELLTDHSLPAKESHMVVRASERRQVLVDRVGLTYELMTPDFQRSYSFYRCIIPPDFDNRTSPFDHPGEEAIHLLSGEVEIFLAGRPHHLEPGDTVTFNAKLPHAWRNTTSQPSVLIGAATPPSS